MVEDTDTDVELFKTNDMSMAAFLSLSTEPLRVEWNDKDNSCYWYFQDTVELSDLVTDFSGGKASVDPKVYSYRYAQMKKDMFALKDGRHRDGHHPVASHGG